MAISDKTVGRLSLFRRILKDKIAEGQSNIYSHDLASTAGVTAAQVRRDLMTIGFSGSPARGYHVEELVRCIGDFLDPKEFEGIALVGVGNLGRALLAYFPQRRPNLTIVAAFDKDPQRTGRVISGCPCYGVEDLSRIVREKNACMGILAVPAGEAQKAADALVKAGVKGILNFARTPLQVPLDVYVENIDMTMTLEKVAFFARRKNI